MLILALNPGHDGAAAVVDGGKLAVSVESEKDSFPRHLPLTPMTLLSVAERFDRTPDVIALSGWIKSRDLGSKFIGAGYRGVALEHQSGKFFGKEVTLFTSSHARSHIMMSIGMAPPDDSPLRAVLVWEGSIGTFYLVDDKWSIAREIPVLQFPGNRFAFLFGLADPSFPDDSPPRIQDPGKLMALAAYSRPEAADSAVSETVEQLLTAGGGGWGRKADLRNSPLYNAGVESEACKAAAALLTERLFQIFSSAALEHIPQGIPLHISGGCGLNCDWNVRWRDLGHFSSVFVPPCTNDSGSAIGTALDAQVTFAGTPYVDWSVYCGLEFEWDSEPDAGTWERRPLDYGGLVERLGNGQIVAWVQGRAEIGPRALGNRSILAEPFYPKTRERLNELKQRESFRPIAPCCRIEDASTAFDSGFEDPYMLYFRMARNAALGAVTHVDGSARCQTVSREENEPLHDLLSAFAARFGVGVLCNTSLNYKGHGFINRMSDLVDYCERRGIVEMVVGDTWFSRPQPES